jgi:TIR domain/Pentapeptide repeats (8 copies)
MLDEHVALLEEQPAWNAFRTANPTVVPDLRDAVFPFNKGFHELNLHGCCFDGAMLDHTSFWYSDLSGASFEQANLKEVKLGDHDGNYEERRKTDLNRRGCSFRGARMTRAQMQNADLTDASFRAAQLAGAAFDGAVLAGADFTGAFLKDASFRGADLTGATFSSCDLTTTKFGEATCSATTFDNVDLSVAFEVEGIRFTSPCAVSISTIFRSSGVFPGGFFAAAQRNLPRRFLNKLERFSRKTPMEYSSCFISYAHIDGPFAEKLYGALNRHGVQCFFDAKSLTPGEPFEHTIPEAVAGYDVFVVVLSKNSIDREWVIKKELALAHDLGKSVLGIKVDDAVDQREDGWRLAPGHISDFRGWKKPAEFKTQVGLMLDALRRKRPWLPQPPPTTTTERRLAECLLCDADLACRRCKPRSAPLSAVSSGLAGLLETHCGGRRSRQCVQYPKALDEHFMRGTRQGEPHGVGGVPGSDGECRRRRHGDAALGSRGCERFRPPRARQFHPRVVRARIGLNRQVGTRRAQQPLPCHSVPALVPDQAGHRAIRHPSHAQLQREP